MRLRLRLPLLLCALGLVTAAPAQAMPAGAVSMSGAKADCVGGRGAPCGAIVRGLMNPVTGVFSDDGRSFYVGSLGNGGIVALDRDPGSGRLRPIRGGAACVGHQQGCEASAHPMPWALAVSHDGRNLYAGGANAEAGLLAFTRDAGTGALAPAGCLHGYKDLCAYPGGSGDNEPLALEITPDDRLLISVTTDGIGVVHRDPATGALTQVEGQCVAASDDWTSYDQPSKGCRVDRGLGRPLELDLSPDGRFAYVAAEEGDGRSGGLQVVAIDPATGAPTITSRVKGGFYEVAVSPDGRNVYAVTTDFDLYAFRRDPATGALTRIAGKTGCFAFTPRCSFLRGVSSPEDLRPSPDGRHLYVAAAEGVSVLRRTADGGLRHLRGRATCDVMKSRFDTRALLRQCHHGPYELGGLTGFEVAPDGRHVYALESDHYNGYGTGVVQLLRRH